MVEFAALVLLVVTSTALLISQRWRVSLGMLALQYFGIFLLVLQSWPVEMAIVKLVAGWMATAVIGLMILSVRSEFEKDEIWPAGRLFRLVMVLLVIITVWSITPSVMEILPGVTTEQITGGMLLISMGLLHLSLISQPLRVIIGLFTVLGGFEIIYAANEGSILVAGILAGINLTFALVGSYLLAAPIIEADSSNAPVIWIVAPGLVAIFLLLINRWYRFTALAAIATCAVSAILIVIVPIGVPFSLGGIEIQINRVLNILGRQLIFQNESIPVVFIVYLGAAFWIGWAYLAKAPLIFPGIALVVSALLIGALTVEPFLYAASIIELIALIFVPLLVQPGQTVRKGVLRFITFFTLGLPFLLLAGWMLTGEGSGNNPFEQNSLAVALLGIGFIFLLAIFPFHSWVPMVMEETHPFTSAFVVFFLSQASLFFVHGLAQRYGWIEQSSEFTLALRIAGIFVIATNGFFLAFQRNLGRILGFFILAESGYALLALGILSEATSLTFYALAIVRMITFSMLAYCVSQLSVLHNSLAFPAIRGGFHTRPWGVLGIIICQFCLLGLPLLAGFPVKFILFQQYTGENLISYIWIIVGIAGALLITLRTLALLVAWQPEIVEGNTESFGEKLPVLLGSGLLVLFGVLPGVTLFLLLTLLQ